MSSILRSTLRYEGPNASSVRRSLRLAGVALVPAILLMTALFFSLMEKWFRVVSDFAAILGLLTFVLGGIWCIVFVPLLIGTLVSLRRIFKDAEIPLEVKTGMAWIVTVAFASMLAVIGFWYSQYNRGWR